MRGDDRLPVVLVLDEINRTDLSRMFGEAFSLLENRGSSARLARHRRRRATPVELRLPGRPLRDRHDELDRPVRRADGLRPAPPVLLAALRLRARARLSRSTEHRWPDYAPKRYGWDRAERGHRPPRRARRGAEPRDRRLEPPGRAVRARAHLLLRRRLPRRHLAAGSQTAPRRRALDASLASRSRPLEDLWTLSLEPVLDQYLEGIDPTAAREEIERLRGVLFDIKAS